MKKFAMLLFVAFAAWGHAQSTPVTLNVIPGGQFDVFYKLSTGPSTSANIKITGDLSANLQFTAGKISQFRFTGGNVAYSNTTSDIIISTVLGVVTKVRLLTRNIVSSTKSRSGAGAINTDTGVISNGDHRLIQDRGTVTTRNMVGSTVVSETVRNLAEQPDENPLVGITTVTSTLLEDLSYKARYQIHFTHSRDESRTVPAEVVSGTMNIREVGSFNARGEVWAPGQTFVDWAQVSRGQTPQSLNELCKTTGQPLVVLYAFNAAPGAWSPPITVNATASRVSIGLPTDGLRAPMRLEFSASLEEGDWAPLTQDGGGLLIFDVGESGTVTMNIPAGAKGFFRLSLAN